MEILVGARKKTVMAGKKFRSSHICILCTGLLPSSNGAILVSAEWPIQSRGMPHHRSNNRHGSSPQRKTMGQTVSALLNSET